MEITLPDDFREFLNLLNANGVEYLLIGGYAVGYYGYPRATSDIDIWIAVYKENADKIVESLKAFGFDIRQLPVDLFLQPQNIVRMGIAPMRIEVLTSISGVKFDECYSERVIDQIDGVNVSLISLKHLKINKKAAGRYKDLDDLEHLP